MPFNPSAAKTQITNTMQAINPNRPAIIMQCIVLSVNPEKLTMDVFIPEISAYYNSVPISFPTKGTNYGIQAMPAKNMVALICINDTSRKPSILAAFTSMPDTADTTLLIKEKILPGENQFFSIGGGFLKQDQSGLSIIGSTDMNIHAFDSDGSNLTSSLGYSERHIGSSKAGGIYFPKSVNYYDYRQLFTESVKVVNREEYYSAIENIRAYTVYDCMDPETHLVNPFVKTFIIDNISNTIGMIQGNGQSGGMSEVLTGFTDSFRNNIQDPDFDTKLADVQNFINQYILANKGVKLTIDKGSAIAGTLGDVREILSKQDFEISNKGFPVCFKISLTDAETNVEKARITLDNDGNCLVKVKDLRIEANHYQLIEGV